MVDLEVTRGDTESLQATVVDAVGVAINLTGATIRFTVRASAADPIAVIAKDNAGLGGITVPSPATGIALIALTPANTRLLTNGRWVYDVQVTEASGRVTTVVAGRIRAAAEVTVA